MYYRWNYNSIELNTKKTLFFFLLSGNSGTFCRLERPTDATMDILYSDIQIKFYINMSGLNWGLWDSFFSESACKDWIITIWLPLNIYTIFNTTR